jgi:hypothetical protein
METFEDYLFGGEVVRIRGREGLGQITKVTSGRLPYHVQHADGAFKCARQHVTVVEGPEADAFIAKQQEQATAAFETFALGTIVKAANTTKHVPSGQLYVVIKAPGVDGKMNVARLGGDGNRYVRTTTGNWTPVPVDEIR